MRYLLRSTSTPASIVVNYEAEKLVSLEFSENTDYQTGFLLKNIPVKECNLIPTAKACRLLLSEVASDTSFVSFWNAYGYKVGKKARTERLWNSMTDIQKQTALSVIPRYKQFVAFKNQDSAYPETWLNNNMWENNYSVI